MFVVAEANLTEKWASMGITEKPTEEDVWGQMRATASQHYTMLLEEGDSYAEVYRKRVESIDKILEKLQAKN